MPNNPHQRRPTLVNPFETLEKEVKQTPKQILDAVNKVFNPLSALENNSSAQNQNQEQQKPKENLVKQLFTPLDFIGLNTIYQKQSDKDLAEVRQFFNKFKQQEETFQAKQKQEEEQKKKQELQEEEQKKREEEERKKQQETQASAPPGKQPRGKLGGPQHQKAKTEIDPALTRQENRGNAKKG